MVLAPVDREVCFSPEGNCDAKLVKFIDSATKSLDVAIFDLSLDQVAHHLLVQSRKGVRVRVLADRRQGKGAHSLIPTLIKGGVDVRYGRQRGIMHNKFAIVDAKMVETGSFNYTDGAARSNNENQLYLAEPTIVRRYAERFEEIWSRSFKRPE